MLSVKLIWILIGCCLFTVCVGEEKIKEPEIFIRGVAISAAVRAEVESIKSLGRAAIIQLANQRLAAAYPHLAIVLPDYEIRVQANAYEVQVNYRRQVHYHPARMKEVKLHYDLAVDLIAKKIQPFDDYFFSGTFFAETAEDRKNIRFVFLGDVPQNTGSQFSVVEEDAYFSLFGENLSGYGYTEIQVLKATGERIDKLELSMQPAPAPQIKGRDNLPNPHKWGQIWQ